MNNKILLPLIFPYIIILNYKEIKKNNKTEEETIVKKTKEIRAHLKFNNSSKIISLIFITKYSDIKSIKLKNLYIKLYNNKNKIIMENKFIPYKNIIDETNNLIKVFCKIKSLNGL